MPLVITVGLCWLLLRDTDLEAMWAIVRRDCDSRWLILDVACLIGAMVARALRWQIQLRALDIRASAGLLTLSVFGTYAVNMVFPRLGEVWRTGFVAARCRSPFTKVFGSMVADRLTDTVAVALISLLAFILAGPQLMDFLANAQGGAAARIGSLLMSPMLWGAIAAVTLIGVWLAVRYPQSRVVSGVRKVVRGLWDGFAVIARMPGKGLWLFYTIALWNCYFWGLWAVFESFPLLREVISQYGLTALLVAFVLTSLSMLVPSKRRTGTLAVGHDIRSRILLIHHPGPRPGVYGHVCQSCSGRTDHPLHHPRYHHVCYHSIHSSILHHPLTHLLTHALDR